MDKASVSPFVNLWKHNKLNQHWTLPLVDLATGFWQSEWADIVKTQWPLSRGLRAYITDCKSGLASTFEEDDYETMHEAVRKEWPK